LKGWSLSKSSSGGIVRFGSEPVEVDVRKAVALLLVVGDRRLVALRRERLLGDACAEGRVFVALLVAQDEARVPRFRSERLHLVDRDDRFRHTTNVPGRVKLVLTAAANRPTGP
jgi:hypothetical protein